MFRDILIVGAGSMLGGISRYLVALLMRGVSVSFPWATFTANLLGCFLVGFLWSLFSRQANLSSQAHLFLAVGFCGSFTTFSTFSKESLAFLQAGNHISFGLYAFGSLFLGILAVAAGFMLFK